MSKQVSEIIGQILVFLFFGVMVLTPLVILFLGIVNLRRDKLHQGVIILQAVAALAVWIILTFALVMIFFMTVFQYPAYKSHSNEVTSNIIFVGGTLIYFLVSSVLIFWTKVQTKRMPAIEVSG